MSRTIVVRPLADRDLDELFDYLASEDPRAARRFYQAAQATFEALAESPGLGGRWESGKSELREYRVWPIRGFKNHLIFYRPIDGGIEIIRVLHGARDLESLFGSE